MKDIMHLIEHRHLPAWVLKTRSDKWYDNEFYKICKKCGWGYRI